jgi:hypothetical protein
MVANGSQSTDIIIEKTKKIVANFHPSGWIKGLFLIDVLI